MENRRIRINGQQQLDNAINAVKIIKADGTKEVIIKDFVRNRSLAQNNLMHMWRSDISNCTGESVKECRLRLIKAHMLPILLSSEEAKDDPIKQTVHKLRSAYKEGNQKDVEFVFNQYASLLSTKDLNVAQFTKMLNNIEIECSQQGIAIRYPSEYNIAMGVK